MPEHKAYSVNTSENGFDVISVSGQKILTCTGRSSAEHYALLLNTAFEAGYKKALRDKRSNAS